MISPPWWGVSSGEAERADVPAVAFLPAPPPKGSVLSAGGLSRTGGRRLLGDTSQMSFAPRWQVSGKGGMEKWGGRNRPRSKSTQG